MNKQTRTTAVEIRISRSDLQALKQQAAKLGMSLNAYVVKVLRLEAKN